MRNATHLLSLREDTSDLQACNSYHYVYDIRMSATFSCRSVKSSRIVLAAFIILPTWVGVPFLLGQDAALALRAQSALESKDYPKAEQLYREMLSHSEASPEILTNLGIVLELEGRSTEAMHAFEMALRQRYLPGTYALLAEEKCKMQDLVGARPMLARILLESPQDTKLLAVVAPCYLEADEPLQSIEVYQRLLSNQSFPADVALIQLAKSYMGASHFFFVRLQSAGVANLPYITAIQAARDQGSINARSAFPEAARASPYFQAGLSYSQVEKIWKQHPKDPALLYQLTVLSGEESMKQLDDCAARYPQSPNLQQFQADVLVEQGQEEAGLERYQQLLRDYPNLPDLRYNLAMLYRKRGEWDKALGMFKEQLTRNPDDERTAARVSESLLELKRYQELRDYLEPLSRKQNVPLWVTLDLAEALQELSDISGAIKLLAGSERINPLNKTIHYRLMRLYALNGNSAEAAKENQLFRSAK
jgi:tetratricopeptide (TPR) repeat protein